MPNLIIGTAGHIDHGKSTLVRALTGIDPDRLPAEKERGLTIDLGFAHMPLPNGQEVGIVDVPGHERFIKNMLAGATGVDFALLVVAADDSVMPQTREHLQILDLLQVQSGLVVVTKIDLMDEETIELVDEEINELLEGRSLEGSPIVHVSSTTGEGIPELKERIIKELLDVQKVSHRNYFRLAVDRVFSVAGFGCVVTGTVTGGKVAVGDELEVLPQGTKVKLRGIQVHDQEAEVAEQGQRGALNLGGIKAGEIERGCQVAEPGRLRVGSYLSGELSLLPDVRQPLKNFTQVKLHLGTIESIARVAFLDRSTRLGPGESTYVQFRLEEPMVADRDDRFVIRLMSPQRTLGGGRILLVSDEKISRFQEGMIHYLKTLSEGDPLDHLEAELKRPRATAPSIEELAQDLGLSIEESTSRLEELGDQCIRFMEGRTERFVHREAVEALGAKLVEVLERYHQKRPILLGLSRNALKQNFTEAEQGSLLNLAINQGIENETITRTGSFFHLAQREPQLDQPAQQIRSQMLQKLEEPPFETPRTKELIEFFKPGQVAEEVLTLLVQTGEVVQISNEVLLLSDNLEQAKQVIREQIEKNESLTVADLRDRLNTSRKYALPLLEYLDEIGFTQRVGDKRILKKSS